SGAGPEAGPLQDPGGPFGREGGPRRHGRGPEGQDQGAPPDQRGADPKTTRSVHPSSVRLRSTDNVLVSGIQPRRPRTRSEKGRVSSGDAGPSAFSQRGASPRAASRSSRAQRSRSGAGRGAATSPSSRAEGPTQTKPPVR